MKTADKFTLSRIVLAPIFFILYFIPEWTGCFKSISVFILIPLLGFMEFTDYLDGHYARKHNEVSDFGKLFDPFGDVIVHLTLFLTFVVSGYIPGFVFLLIFYREFCMHFIRMVALKKGVAIAARKGGKAKTVMYVVCVFYYLILECISRLGIALSCAEVLQTIGYVLCGICIVACYSSFIDYLIHFKNLLKTENK